MSDLDENLTSILSDLIDTEGIETANTPDLADSSTFNGSRLDFENLANCITGSDASLHQCSDENVTSLLESHLNEFTETDSTSIVDTTTEQLDDVTPFDLDKPIESLLESTSTCSSEFISQECSHSQLPIIDKSVDLSNASDVLTTIRNESLNDLEDEQLVLGGCNQNGNEISNILSQYEIEASLRPTGSSDIGIAENLMLNSLDDIEAGDLTTDNFEDSSHIENQVNLPFADRTDVVEGAPQCSPPHDDEHCETIIADRIVEENVQGEEDPKHEIRKRRRILVYNDGQSDSSELEEEREKLLESKSPDQQLTGDNDENENQPENDLSSHQSDDGKVYNIDEEYNYIRLPNEKPGPKSKKQSTYLYNALKAKALLESAIVIPARKKKKRVIESDDENSDFALNQPIASVDDIGLITDDNNPMPLNVSIEIEQREILVETQPKIRVKNDLLAEPTDVGAKNSRFNKKKSLSRTTTQAKMERYRASNNNRRSHKRKDSEDLFSTPLNAPYVDSSSDEDYFLPHDTNTKSHHSNSQRWSNNGSTSSSHQRKKKGHIPDDIYFNAKVPLHILYSYDDSSSDDEKKTRSITQSTHSHKSSFQPTNRTLNKMPPVHKIVPKPPHLNTKNCAEASRTCDENAETSQPTVFEQLDKLKRFLKASGIKVNMNELLKGSKTFQERCERIRNILYQNGIEGEPTMAKCKQLKKQLKLKEEIAGLDPNAIIDAKEDEGLPKRTTRRATRRNYVYDESDDSIDSSSVVQTVIDSNERIALPQAVQEQTTIDESQNVPSIQADIGNVPVQCTIQSLDQV